MKKTVFIAVIAVFLIALVPLFILKDADFGGSDDAGSTVVEEVDSSYEPWAAPVLEKLLGRELPGEVESLFFCIRMPNKYTHNFSSVFLCKTLIILCNNIFNHFLCFFSSSYLAIRLNNSAMKLKDRFYIQKFSRLSG